MFSGHRRAVFGGGHRAADTSGHRLTFEEEDDEDDTAISIISSPNNNTKRGGGGGGIHNNEGTETGSQHRKGRYGARQGVNDEDSTTNYYTRDNGSINRRASPNQATYYTHSPTAVFGSGKAAATTPGSIRRNPPSGYSPLRSSDRKEGLPPRGGGATRFEFTTLSSEEEAKGTLSFACTGTAEDDLLLPDHVDENTISSYRRGGDDVMYSSQQFGGTAANPNNNNNRIVSKQQHPPPAFLEEPLSTREEKELFKDGEDPDNTLVTLRLNYIPGIEVAASEFELRFNQPPSNTYEREAGVLSREDPMVFGPGAMALRAQQQAAKKEQEDKAAKKRLDALVEYWANGGRTTELPSDADYHRHTTTDNQSTVDNGKVDSSFDPLVQSDSLRHILELTSKNNNSSAVHFGGGYAYQPPQSTATNVCVRRVGVYPVTHGSKQATMAHAARFGHMSSH